MEHKPTTSINSPGLKDFIQNSYGNPWQSPYRRFNESTPANYDLDKLLKPIPKDSNPVSFEDILKQRVTVRYNKVETETTGYTETVIRCTTPKVFSDIVQYLVERDIEFHVTSEKDVYDIYVSDSDYVLND